MNVASRGGSSFAVLVDEAAEMAAATETVVTACASGGDPGPEAARVGAELFSAYDDIRRRVRAYPRDDRVEALAELLVYAEDLLGLALEHAYGPSGTSPRRSVAALVGGNGLVAQFLALKSMPVRGARS